MSDFTRLGCSIWDWEPWTALDSQARILWLALYTSSEAKRIVPGLWHGGIPTLAEASRLQPDQVWASLDTLLEHDLIEYDRKLRVIHLTVLPDAGERPMNGKHIMGWWNRFVTVPRCQVRDAHIRVLRWLVEQGVVTEDHEKSWAKTFGDTSKVQIPPPRKRGVRRLVEDESDTSTAVQPSLFPSGASPSESPSENPIRKKSGSPDTVCDTVTHTVCDTHTDTDPDTDPDLISGIGGGSGEGHAAGKPTLVLVPMPPAVTEHDLVNALWPDPRTRPVLTDTRQFELQRAISTADDSTLTQEAIVLLAEFARGRRAGISPEEVTRPGRLRALVQEAIAWKRESAEKSAALAEARKQLGF